MIYAIGDLHGIITVTKKLFEEILFDIRSTMDEDNTIIFLGDYCDRGDYSKEVLDFLIDIQKNKDQHFKNLDINIDIDIIFLWGNHEDMMSSVIDGDNKMLGTWLHNGGIQTLESFGLYDKINNKLSDDLIILKPYNDWMKDNLKLYYETEDYIFCHSGFIRVDIALDLQQDNLLWGRAHTGMYIGYGKTIVHGHTPTKNGLPFDEPYRICVDVGCGKFNDSLVCVVLPNTANAGLSFRYIQVYGESGNKSFI